MKKEQIPNILTIGRILFIPIFIFILTVGNSIESHMVAAIIFAIASITDYLLLLHWTLLGQVLLYVALFFTIYSGYDYFKGSAYVFKGTFGSK